MSEQKYTLSYDDKPIAYGMELNTCLLLIKELIEYYYEEKIHDFTIVKEIVNGSEW